MTELFASKHRKVKIALGIAVLGGAAVLLQPAATPAADKSTASTAPKAALTVRAVKLAPAQMSQTLSANGSVMAWQEAVIGAELAGLRITEIKVNVGDHVRQGEPLALLATDSPQAAEAESHAALLESEARLADAHANAERMRKLAAAGFISEQQAIQANMNEEAARARVEAQRARHRADQVKLSQTRIVAPDDGVISASTATVGTLTQPGVELFRLIRKGRLEWRADLTANELAQVRKGMAVEVQVAPGQTVSGRVRAVSPAVSTKTLYGQVLVDLPQDPRLIAGQFARGAIRLGAAQAGVPSLPVSAVLFQGDAASVFVIGPDHRVQARKVSVGQRSAERVAITSGLGPDAAVVESGAAFLTSGDVVQMVQGQ